MPSILSAQSGKKSLSQSLVRMGRRKLRHRAGYGKHKLPQGRPTGGNSEPLLYKEHRSRRRNLSEMKRKIMLEPTLKALVG